MSEPLSSTAGTSGGSGDDTVGTERAGAIGGDQASGDGGDAAEEKTEFDVILESFDASAKIKVLKAVREATGLGLADAKGLVEKAPTPVKEGIAKEAAEEMKKAIEEAGGKVTLK